MALEQHKHAIDSDAPPQVGQRCLTIGHRRQTVFDQDQVEGDDGIVFGEPSDIGARDHEIDTIWFHSRQDVDNRRKLFCVDGKHAEPAPVRQRRQRDVDHVRDCARVVGGARHPRRSPGVVVRSVRLGQEMLGRDTARDDVGQVHAESPDPENLAGVVGIITPHLRPQRTRVDHRLLAGEMLEADEQQRVLAGLRLPLQLLQGGSGECRQQRFEQRLDIVEILPALLLTQRSV